MGTDGTLKRELARRLTTLLNGKAWNGSELARRATPILQKLTRDTDKEVTRDNISSYLNGKAIPGTAKLEAIAKALGVEATDIVPIRRAMPQFADTAGMVTAEKGMVRLTIDRDVPIAVGVKIMQLLDEGPQPMKKRA